mgnify:CR=1 FL=1
MTKYKLKQTVFYCKSAKGKKKLVNTVNGIEKYVSNWQVIAYTKNGLKRKFTIKLDNTKTMPNAKNRGARAALVEEVEVAKKKQTKKKTSKKKVKK